MINVVCFLQHIPHWSKIPSMIGIFDPKETRNWEKSSEFTPLFLVTTEFTNLRNSLALWSES